VKPMTCSIEPAKRLAELGVTVKSYFCYERDISGEPHCPVVRIDMGFMPHGYCPAYTVGELLDATKRWGVVVESCRGEDGMDFCAWFSRFGGVEYSDSPANALALCIIGAIKNKHITAEEINGGGI